MDKSFRIARTLASKIAVVATLLSMALPASTRVGRRAPRITLQNLSGSSMDVWPLPGGKTAVFIFLAHDCPIANSYAPEIGRIEEKYAKRKVVFYEVYSESDLSLAAAKSHHREYRLKGVGLLDPKTKLAKALGAKVTPQVFVVSGRSILYSGRIDNTYAAIGVRRQVTTKHDLIDALDLVLKAPGGGALPKPRVTTSYGCSITIKH